MNGGAWLTVGDCKVDVLLRDVEFVDHWSARARAGEYDVDFLLGYLAGIPTYSVLAECSIAVVLRGDAPAAEPYPARLAEVGGVRWPFHRDFSIEQARMRARRGDATGAVGHAARAVIETAHALLCERRIWVLNEKRMVERAGLLRAQRLFRSVPEGDALLDWVARVEATLADDAHG